MVSNSQVLMISFMRYWDDKSCLAEEIYNEELYENTKIPFPILTLSKYHYQLQYSRNDLWLTRVLEDQWKNEKQLESPQSRPTKCPLKGFWQCIFCKSSCGNTLDICWSGTDLSSKNNQCCKYEVATSEATLSLVINSLFPQPTCCCWCPLADIYKHVSWENLTMW